MAVAALTGPVRFDCKAAGLVYDEDKWGLPLQLCCCAEDDDGVPPCCKARVDWFCIFSHSHPCLNGKAFRSCLGRFGFKHFERFRKLYLGLASWFSIFALVLTIYGCCALSPNNSVVRRTYWAGVNGANFNNDSSYSMYVGLTTFLYSNCSFVPGYYIYPASCDQYSIEYVSSECHTGGFAGACSSCSQVATSLWVAAVTNCIGLVLGTNGAQIRMKRIADVPVQKLLGMFADLIGAITLAISLFQFRYICHTELHEALVSEDRGASAAIWTGPGFICYAICAASALVRAIVHWLTPIPPDSVKPIGEYPMHAVGVNEEVRMKEAIYRE